MNAICDKMGDASPEELEVYMEDLGTIQDMLTMHDFYMIDAKVEEVGRALGLSDIGLDRDVSDLTAHQSPVGQAASGKTGYFTVG